jgi:hypothetical protein|tara:strand:+ start:3182 stop:3490 length:309 start_codon:yes stop_codon:yes gene_type:complete
MDAFQVKVPAMLASSPMLQRSGKTNRKKKKKLVRQKTPPKTLDQMNAFHIAASLAAADAALRKEHAELLALDRAKKLAVATAKADEEAKQARARAANGAEEP